MSFTFFGSTDSRNLGLYLLNVKTFVVGSLSTNCYVVSCESTKSSVIIDPGFMNKFEAEKVFSFIINNELKLESIVCTHGHPDHTCGNELVKNRFNVPICVHEDDAYMLGERGKDVAMYFGYDVVSPSPDVLLHEGTLIEIGAEILKVVHTPGHSPGSVVLLADRKVFSGDTLFAGSIGRTDFPGSSETKMRNSLRKLFCLDNSCIVYPGHGSDTIVGIEKRVNPFLQDL